ncbi:ANTAR domain-containing protein [Nocardia asteroides]
MPSSTTAGPVSGCIETALTSDNDTSRTAVVFSGAVPARRPEPRLHAAAILLDSPATGPGPAPRLVIEQTKGVLMRMYGIDAEQAFKVLVWHSQEANITLRDIAAQVIADLKLLPAPPLETLATFDHLLLTGYESIDALRCEAENDAAM